MTEVVRFLERWHQVTEFEPAAGEMQIVGGDRALPVTLPPELMGEYLAQLDEEAIPDLAEAPPERGDRIRAKYIGIWIEEIVGSDLGGSLRSIVLTRGTDGSLVLEAGRRQVASGHQPPWGDGAYWTAARPAD